MNNDDRLIAILRNIEPAYACDIVSILLEEGVRCLEVSLSEPEKAFGCIRAIKNRFASEAVTVGAGTVSTPEEVDRLKALGVGFFVTPGFDGPLVDYALAAGMEVVPGVLTPSDVQQVKNRGLRLAKLFPANAFPLGYVRDLKGPFPRMDFLAVGGVSPSNLRDYLAAGFVGAGIGSSLVPQQAGPAQYEGIRQAAARCVAALDDGKEGPLCT